ncbi:MAG: phosphoribosylformylglycinamidine synthase subunit PurS [Phycisphaeraceae bacterium]|nr:phosphoribosylformylglycinamidine synthase subunit PurS [Phycisphaeraceae bacterium]
MTIAPTDAPPSDVFGGPMSAAVHRIEVYAHADQPDPVAQGVLAQAQTYFPTLRSVRTARVYLVQAALSADDVARVGQELLADPINQTAIVGAAEAPHPGVVIEVHYQPGVMDPVAQSTQDALREMLAGATEASVRTGFRYDFVGDGLDAAALQSFAEKTLANPVIQDIHVGVFHPAEFPRTHAYQFRLTHVPILNLDDAGLAKLSRDGHLFLSLDEMKAVQEYFRGRGAEPTDIELETLAQTWSEHCVHKTLKARVEYTQTGSVEEGTPGPRQWMDRPNHSIQPDGSLVIDNLLKSTIAAATGKLMAQEPHKSWCVSVFKDNSGVVRFDDQDAVCIKVETHNHPSAIEPYGGAATGIGGCIRDVLGTGLAAKPIANTDVFCVAPPEVTEVPKGVIPPKRILEQVVAGIRDYGNRKGIPTINGTVYFHPNYLGNPLVFAGCVGLIPLDKCFGQAKPGDRIIALGGATGRDGIHGATFSSAELTDTHADEFAHAVQIGNAITQKKTLDVILQARDPRMPDGTTGQPLFNAITDCGAGGFSSAVGEMGSQVGACVTLETAPLKYAGLSYTEIWISEAQERMILAVPPENVPALKALCDAEDVSLCDLGQFGWHAEGPGVGEPTLVLTYHGQEVGRLSMPFLHDGLPRPVRKATWSPEAARNSSTAGKRLARKAAPADLGVILHELLAHPNIASKHWIIRQYDHEVQGGSAVKPLVGPGQDGPSDGAVLRPKLNSDRGIAIACGLAPSLSETAMAGLGLPTHGDSYAMAVAAIDEAVRNLICVGADPRQIAILDNFCWPRCDDPLQLGSLVRAAQGCYDASLTYGVPFVSGKDSLSNQFTTDDGRVIAIPQTLLITGLGIVPDVKRARTMDAKAPGNALLLVGSTESQLGGSQYLGLYADPAADPRIARVDLSLGTRCAAAVAALVERGLIASAHDCSDGGLLVAAAEMAFAGRVGLDLDLDRVPSGVAITPVAAAYAETPSRYLLEVAPESIDAVVRLLRAANVPFAQVGRFADHPELRVRTDKQGMLLRESLDGLRKSWLGTLDW